MQDLNDKAIDGTLTAVEWNELPSEIQNVIEATTYLQTLSSGDLDQLGKGIAGYAASATFYTGTGTANAHIATKLSGMQAPPNYGSGMVVRFRPSNVNTAAATINVDGLGVKTIKKEDGSTLGPGDLDTTRDAWLRYDGTDFLLSNWSGSGGDPAEFVGFWERTSGATYTLKPGIGGNIIINIDGARLVRSTDLVFDFTFLDTGAEAASTEYYFYIDNIAGVMTPVISISPPVDLGSGGKIGYHPTRTDERCVLGVNNDVGSDFPQAIHMRDGRVMYVDHDGQHELDLAEGKLTTWNNLNLNIPFTAMSVLLATSGQLTSGAGMVVWGRDGASSTLTDAARDPRADPDIMFFVITQTGTTTQTFSLNMEIPITDRLDPAVRYGMTEDIVTGTHFGIVLGYHDWCAPTW